MPGAYNVGGNSVTYRAFIGYNPTSKIINIQSLSQDTRTNAPYDVWVRYTK